jgi:hypothetical protein
MSENNLLTANTNDPSAGGCDDRPLEWLEAQICELAGHLTAATARFLMLLGDFDSRQGWATWDLPSCAAWLSWKCQLSPGTAREHVRVARALPELPAISAAFAAGQMSYAKVRALTRIATPATEADLAELAGPMTASQLERFARAHRQVSRADGERAEMLRRLTWRQDEDGSLALTVRLPPADGAVVLQALRAAVGDLEPEPAPEDTATSSASSRGAPGNVPAETPAGPDGPAAAPAADGRTFTPASLADALVDIAGAFLAGKVATAANPDLYQVIVHVGADTLADDTDGVPAETSPAPDRPRRRCHIQDGPALSPLTAKILACDATVSWMLQDMGRNVLDVGRRRRVPTAALRRAVLERDGCRCQFPGCNSRRVDIHHIKSWADGGETKLSNLTVLCKFHHRIVHRKGYVITPSLGGWQFTRPDGALVDRCPCLPEPDGHISDCHDASISMDTIVPAWYGDKLDLDFTIWACFANATIAAERRQRTDADQPQPAADAA